MTTFYIPVKTIIGLNSLEQLPDLVRQYGKHPLLIHGHRPVEDGLLQKVRAVLDQAGIEHSDMGQILPNPRYDSVKRGVKTAKAEHCDMILSLGGGSTLQCAKGIAYGMAYKGKHLWKLWQKEDTPKGSIPVGCVLTNPATGDELDDACTIVRNGEQKTLTSPWGYAKFAILDPSLSILPEYPTMTQCFEAFAYLLMRTLNAQGCDLEMDLILMQKLKEASSALRQNQQDLDARDTLFYTSFLAHALHEKNPFALSSLSGSIAFHCSLSAGEAMSALFDAWFQVIAPKYTSRMAQIGRSVFQVDASDDEQAVKMTEISIKSMIQSMGLASSLKNAGISLQADKIEKLAKNKEEKEIIHLALQ